jgi:arylsulfatase A-like enzyme
VLQWPGVVPRGIVSQANAAHFDLFATILDAAGLELSKTNGRYPVSGVSLLPHLCSGGRQDLADRHLFWELYGSVAALHGDWKLVGELSNHHGDFRKAYAEAERATSNSTIWRKTWAKPATSRRSIPPSTTTSRAGIFNGSAKPCLRRAELQHPWKRKIAGHAANTFSRA